jgi:dimeric dUTPase (all-alpha-NTP-PPase superfamily)
MMQTLSKTPCKNWLRRREYSDLIHFLNSIVAVHGLNPTNKESHARQTWTSDQSKKLWLSDSEFLPKSFPQARVMLFGYNSNVAFQTSTAGVREQAENLLNRVKIERSVISY